MVRLAHRVSAACAREKGRLEARYRSMPGRERRR